MHQLHEIFVTNHNREAHIDAFNGVEYIFPPDERVAVPVEAATHMLGFNLKDKTEVLSRLGWAFRVDGKTNQITDASLDGARKLAAFEFTKAVLSPMGETEPAEAQD